MDIFQEVSTEFSKFQKTYLQSRESKAIALAVVGVFLSILGFIPASLYIVGLVYFFFYKKN